MVFLTKNKKAVTICTKWLLWFIQKGFMVKTSRSLFCKWHFYSFILQKLKLKTLIKKKYQMAGCMLLVRSCLSGSIPLDLFQRVNIRLESHKRTNSKTDNRQHSSFSNQRQGRTPQ